MSEPAATSTTEQQSTTEGPHEVSLLLGGPFFQLLLRTGLMRPTFDLLVRRILTLALLPWLPLLVLTLASGTALGGGVAVPFLFDVDVHARFLVMVPLLVLAERVIHMRLRPALGRFLERGLVGPEDAQRFDAILAGARRWRNSFVAEGLLLLASFALTPWLWAGQIALKVPTWYGSPTASGPELTVAGMWFVYFGLPLARFLIWRWLYRLLLLYVALARVSRLPLKIVPTHPDTTGGLSFLGELGFALQPFNAAISALVSGFIANKILHEGHALPDYYPLIGCVVAVVFLFTFVPMLFFAPLLGRARRRGLAEYGGLAQQYVRDFHKKWIQSEPAGSAALLGSADIQSLADLSTAFDLVRDMRPLPLGLRQAAQLVAVSVLPFAPLVLTLFPLETLLRKLLDVVF